jgi:hypothetical protein
MWLEVMVSNCGMVLASACGTWGNQTGDSHVSLGLRSLKVIFLDLRPAVSAVSRIMKAKDLWQKHKHARNKGTSSSTRKRSRGDGFLVARSCKIVVSRGRDRHR